MKAKRFLRLDFMINILFFILISICLIETYFNISVILIIIYGFLRIIIRAYYFNSVRDWPSYHPIAVIIMTSIAVIYVRFMGMEFINNYIKYITFISLLIIYILVYLVTKKK